jgi:3-oxoacyl-[acyl-carrier-protein] synthase-3
MGTTLDGVTTVLGGWRSRHHALRLATQATTEALAKAGVQPAEVDLLINAGIYRDGNLGEPALAPLIQQDAGVNPEDPHGHAHGTFSFDVANGACGVLTALQVADGFLAAGTAKLALIVTSDARPGRRLAPRFPFAPAGGALVGRWADKGRGLGSFHWLTEPDEGASFRATVGLQHGRNTLIIDEDETFAERAGAVAAKVAHEALADTATRPDDVGLVVASPARPGFVAALASNLGIPADRIVTAGKDLHTVGFVAALDAAVGAGRLEPDEPVIFVCAGAGVTAGAVTYRP